MNPSWDLTIVSWFSLKVLNCWKWKQTGANMWRTTFTFVTCSNVLYYNMWEPGSPGFRGTPWLRPLIDIKTAPKIRDTLVTCWLPLKLGTSRCPWFHGYAPDFIDVPLISGSSWFWHFGKIHKCVYNFAYTIDMKFIFSDSSSTNITWIFDEVFTAWI